MSICSICGKEIDRGKKYQNERYKNIIVCSKECYEQLIETKKNAVKKEPYPDYNVLLDYIKDQWLGSENVNWLLTVKFIKFLVEKKNMSCKDIYNVIKYAVEIEGYSIQFEYGLGQIFPKYIEPFNKFMEKIKNNKQNAKQIDIQINTIPFIKQKRRVKEEQWD